VKEHVEREVKLQPSPGFTLPELGGEQLRTRVFISTYHDTADLVLARHGVTFRHRVEDGAGSWQLKLPKGVARIELEHPGPPARPPLEMLALLVAYLRGRPLVPVARLRTRREGVRARGMEILDDSVFVLDGPRVTRRFREVEIELLEGDERTLRRLEKELRRAGADSSDRRPKLYRALDLTAPADHLSIPREAAPAVALGIALEEQLRRLLAHDPGTRLGTDPEDLHQLRVATRRLRAFLRAARPHLDREWADSLRTELSWLGTALGPARDLDVLTEYLTTELEQVGAGPADAQSLLAFVAAERAPARNAVVEALSSERYLELLDRLEQAATPPMTGERTSLTAVWLKQQKRLRREVAALGSEPTDEQLHTVRIFVKRSRYAAELAAHELGKRGARFVQAAKAAQDVLGAHQDSVVAEERIRVWAANHPQATPLAAELIGRQLARRVEARHAWPEVWKELDRRAQKARG
jgi:CHAD domain-containing protein